MNNPLGVSPSKGKQGTTRGKEKIFWPRWESNFLFAAIHHLKSSPTFSVWPCSSVGRVTEDLIRRSWVRFPPRSKDFFFASCGSLSQHSYRPVTSCSGARDSFGTWTMIDTDWCWDNCFYFIFLFCFSDSNVTGGMLYMTIPVASSNFFSGRYSL